MVGEQPARCVAVCFVVAAGAVPEIAVHQLSRRESAKTGGGRLLGAEAGALSEHLRASVSDPPVVLRLTGSGSLTQALDCDPTKSRLEDEIASLMRDVDTTGKLVE